MQVTSYTPEWLTRDSPGFDFFASSKDIPSNTSSTNKRLTHRGSEVFLALGTQIRWADLTLLEACHGNEGQKGWRYLKSPAVHPIQQLSVSPDGNFLAIVTKHTCHVMVLQSASLLRSGDETPLRLRSFQVGPTAHVLEQAPIATSLWHPLSVPGMQSLVTVTTDACVRLWELDPNNRHSFDQAGVAIDLRKLVDATSTAVDLSASKLGTNRGFGPDQIEMVVASACFGGRGLDDEYGWSSMTLWFTMTEGDVYALCPFLPSRFRLANTTLPSLSTGVVAEGQIFEADQSALDREKLRSQQQSAWLADLDAQEPVMLSIDDYTVESYSRPEKLGAVAKLQGPFQLADEVLVSPITDIYVVAPVTDDAMLFGEDEVNEVVNKIGLSAGIICLGTASGRVHICLELEGVQAEWLPEKRKRAFALDDEVDEIDLLLFQTVVLAEGSPTSFTHSPLNRYEVLTTTGQGVFNLDFGSWIYSIEDELASDSTAGVDFRFNILLESQNTTVTPIITASTSDNLADLTTAVALNDAHLGYFVLTSTSSGPHSATIFVPQRPAHPYEPTLLELPAPELRESYQPAPQFHSPNALEMWLSQQHTNPVTKNELIQPIRSKPETLHLITEAHRILSQETHLLGLAAADLFRRCERMCAELADQVRTVDEISQKTNSITTTAVTAEDEDDSVDAQIDQRIMQVESNASNMNERFEQLRRKMLRLGGAELSIKERAFANEIGQLQSLTLDGDTTASIDSMSVMRLPDDTDTKGVLTQRMQAAVEVSETLVGQAEDYSEKQDAGVERRRGNAGANEYRKQKLDTVMQLLEREIAMMDAVTVRLGRIGESA